MAQYDHEHSSGWNKLLHGIGIPMIFAGIILFLFAKWIWGGSFFVGGWVLVGPIWVAKEAWMFLTGEHRAAAPENTRTK